ncbi:MAG: RNA methyltransferase [candidate division Zixibacteria bacterium]|nr:RNA methyltransferase [candidate division Zixibacteria bacterium]
MKIKSLRTLLTRKGRHKHNAFLAEGVRLLEEAFRHSYYPCIVYYASSLLSHRGEKLVEHFRQKHIELMPLSARQLNMLADTKTPQGIVAKFDVPRLDIDELFTPKTRNILVCENIADPGNLGTLLRSAMAFDFRLILLCGSCVEPYSPKVVRSSMGAIFGVKVAQISVDGFKQFVEENSGTVVATSLEGKNWQSCYKKLHNANPRLLVVGSEVDGLSKEMQSISSVNLRIDHSLKVESLNVAVAGSIIMKQIYDSFINR